MNELMHYGVLGMKWGIRRYQQKKAQLRRKGEKALTKALELRPKVYKTVSISSYADHAGTIRITDLKKEKKYKQLCKKAEDFVNKEIATDKKIAELTQKLESSK